MYLRKCGWINNSSLCYCYMSFGKLCLVDSYFCYSCSYWYRSMMGVRYCSSIGSYYILLKLKV